MLPKCVTSILPESVTFILLLTPVHPIIFLNPVQTRIMIRTGFRMKPDLEKLGEMGIFRGSNACMDIPKRVYFPQTLMGSV
jgi:hypothetical protein